MRIEIRLNGEAREIPESLNIAQMLEHFEFPKDRVAVERNRAIVPKPQWESVSLGQGDEVEVVHFVGGGSGNDAPFVIAGRTFKSRLIVGTGKYSSNQVMAEAHRRSGTDMVTVAVRRIDLKAPKGESLLDYIDRERIMILPNTAACYNVEDAVRTARLGREAVLGDGDVLGEPLADEEEAGAPGPRSNRRRGQLASTAAIALAVASTLCVFSPATHMRPERTR